MRFYIDGDELDVQDPTFFIDEEQYKINTEAITEMMALPGTSCEYSTIGDTG